ncbi:hypothetical protein DFJ67_3371 [Asanoa ferruginea]|uniref:Uncharacterized protein n=1 Tax=Asanoa ferruginea TaxID=53367 RepID=A0A3D9ZLA4_9ACTN|nr:hypothetical protein [Asanoa ferruginea]REF97374.1 hypothetical protein DFJ67_3371 [Asanoa ferruginea]GIF51161.1 hypothetical protein Afe04nite_57000 [Asanoa ferruginea]
MNIDIAWGDLGLVTAVGLVLGAGVTVLYAIGIRVLTPAPDPALGGDPHETESHVRPTPLRLAATILCFAVCAAAVAYGIFTLL